MAVIKENLTDLYSNKYFFAYLNHIPQPKWLDISRPEYYNVYHYAKTYLEKESGYLFEWVIFIFYCTI